MTHCGEPTSEGPCIRRIHHRGRCRAASENRRQNIGCFHKRPGKAGHKLYDPDCRFCVSVGTPPRGTK